MSKLERITVTMSEQMAAQLRAVVDSGEYTTVSEVVREAVRGWSSQHERELAAKLELASLIEQARKGPFLDGPGAMAELRARYVAKAGTGG